MSAQVVLVTGATSGLGRAIAIELAERGHTVFGTSRNPADQRVPGVELLPLEIGSEESARACVAAVVARAGRLDVLINNVGSMLFGAAEEVSMAELREQLELNLLGTARMVVAALPTLRAQGAGKIINLSSLGGLVGLPFLSAYTASKFALEGYSEALRLELLPLGIAVSLVEPAGARTESLDRSQRRAATIHPAYGDAAGRTMARMRADQERTSLTPGVVARAVAAIVAAPRPRLRYVVGGQAGLVVALKRLLPQGLYEAMVGRQLRVAPQAGAEQLSNQAR